MNSIHRTKTVEVAKAEAERIKLVGGSEAAAIEAVGKAEAEKMRLKAAAYKQYGDAAMMSLVLETLPKVSTHAHTRTHTRRHINTQAVRRRGHDELCAHNTA